MGNCFGRCLPSTDSYKSSFRNTKNGLEFSLFVEDHSTKEPPMQRKLFSRFFRKRKEQKATLCFVDGFLTSQLTSYSRLTDSGKLLPAGSATLKDVEFQCLDARALLSRTASPVSSVELEWEHEQLPNTINQDPSRSSWITFPEEGSSEFSPRNAATVINSDSDWSRVSSANSLEWDNVQNLVQDSPPLSEVDADTQMLICEIERLTCKTLSETGHDLFS